MLVELNTVLFQPELNINRCPHIFFSCVPNGLLCTIPGVHTPGMHGPPLETIGSRNNFSHKQGCFDLKRPVHFSYSAIL